MSMETKDTELEALSRAISVAGGQSALARLIEESPRRVNEWLRRDGRASARKVLAIEKATGIPRWLLRPDIYPREEYRCCKNNESSEK